MWDREEFYEERSGHLTAPSGRWGLARRGWTRDRNLVLVVAAGRGARQQAREFGLYHSQNHRTFRHAFWIAFYSDGVIDTMAEIDGPPADDVIIAAHADLKRLADVMRTTNGDPAQPHCLFVLRDTQSVGPIRNDMVGRSGQRVAWTQHQRYTTIDRLRSAQFTSQL